MIQILNLELLVVKEISMQFGKILLIYVVAKAKTMADRFLSFTSTKK